MATATEHLAAKTVVVGSGPGGATVARELARRGEDVLVLEMGAEHRPLGSYFTLYRMADAHGNLTSVEGNHFGRMVTVGGCSVAFCGTAVKPHAWLKERYGVDLEPYIEAAATEHKLAPLPERLIGEGANRIMAAAREGGLDWSPLPKLIDPEKCQLTAKCYCGCPNGAKWSARDYVDEAVGAGGRLRTRMKVEAVLSENGRVTGVRGTGGRAPFMVEAETVVLAGNGMGTAMIMQASGFPTAGKGVFVDPLVTTYGAYDGKGSINDIPMSCGTSDLLDEGLFMADAWDPWPLLARGILKGNPRHIDRMFRYRRTLGILTKIRDGLDGSVAADGTLTKPFSEQDKGRFKRGAEIATDILVRAGCDPDTVFTTPPMGANPSGTVRIGDLVDADLKTEMAGLYVCDTSVLPEPDGLPPVLTLLGLGRRLVAEQLAPKKDV